MIEAETSYNAGLERQNHSTIKRMNEMFNELKEQITELKVQSTEKNKLIDEINETVKSLKGN